MDKVDRLRAAKAENEAAQRTRAAQIAAKEYPDLADALEAAPFFLGITESVTLYVSASEYVVVNLSSDEPFPYRIASDYGSHIQGESKSGAPIVGTFEDGKFVRVVEWDGGQTAYAFSYDASTGQRAKSCRVAYRVGRTHKGFFIAIYTRRHYILPPPSDNKAEV